MTRRCEITGKGPMAGNNVSHSKARTRRRFLPNLQKASFFSDTLKKGISVIASVSGIRTIEHKGGIDSYLLNTAPTKLPADMRKWRKLVAAKSAEKKAA